jgi:hypothetical protein
MGRAGQGGAELGGQRALLDGARPGQGGVGSGGRQALRGGADDRRVRPCGARPGRSVNARCWAGRDGADAHGRAGHHRGRRGRWLTRAAGGGWASSVRLRKGRAGLG